MCCGQLVCGMSRSVALLLAAASLGACALATEHFDYHISDEQYYSMPALFELDEYSGCVARGHLYCVGSFELTPISDDAVSLYHLMERYSANWVDRFNHTRVHRGVCVDRRCPLLRDLLPSTPDVAFSTCVNSTMSAEYNMSARLWRLESCEGAPLGVTGVTGVTAVAGVKQEGVEGPGAPLSVSARALAALFATLLALSALSTVLDLTLTPHARKGLSWALSWSVHGCWQSLMSSPSSPPAPCSTPGGALPRSDLSVFDGVRVICMLCVMIEHVCWLTTLSYTANPRFTEVNRRASDVMLMTNSTLVVQIFFMMSTFLLAHKLLQGRRRGRSAPILATFLDTMLNRIIRISPTYWVVVWFAASWWPRLGEGPLWPSLVASEAQVCRDKWWTHLLYLNNVLYPDDKCLIQTWYLAADMQLYAASLLLTLLLLRWRSGALYLLSACLLASLMVLSVLAYVWRLVPTFVMHRPECIRAAYHGSRSFNVLYQSPLGNVPGALAGLLLAHLHDHLLHHPLKPTHYKWFRWCSLAAFPLSVLWAGLSPLLLGGAPPSRAAAAALAVLERPIFAFGIGFAVLGVLHGVKSPWQRCFSWSGWSPLARLSFSALLLHMPINKSLVASRLQLNQLDRFTAVFEWCGIATISYLAAIPLALLVELPCQRLHRALTPLPRRPGGAPSPRPLATHDAPHTEDNNNIVEKTDRS